MFVAHVAACAPRTEQMTSMRAQLVLIHGLSVPSMIWQDVAPELASKGFRILVYGTPPHPCATSHALTSARACVFFSQICTAADTQTRHRPHTTSLCTSHSLRCSCSMSVGTRPISPVSRWCVSVRVRARAGAWDGLHSPLGIRVSRIMIQHVLTNAFDEYRVVRLRPHSACSFRISSRGVSRSSRRRV